MEKVPAPREVVAALYRHFLGAADAELRRGGEPGDAERVLCARAMAALYHSHAAAIGAALCCSGRLLQAAPVTEPRL